MKSAYIRYDIVLGGLARHLEEPIPLPEDYSTWLKGLPERKSGAYCADNGRFDVFVNGNFVTFSPQASKNPAVLSISHRIRLPLSKTPGLEKAVVLFDGKHPLTLKVDGKTYSFIPPKTAQRSLA